MRAFLLFALCLIVVGCKKGKTDNYVLTDYDIPPISMEHKMETASSTIMSIRSSLEEVRECVQNAYDTDDVSFLEDALLLIEDIDDDLGDIDLETP